jgi:hypothetical protein
MAALPAATAIMPSEITPARAESDPASVQTAGQTAGVGMPTPALPTAPPVAALPAAPGRTPAGITVPATHHETLNDCMGYWDKDTHMSKSEWHAACQRTFNGTDMGNLELLTPQPAPALGGALRRSGRSERGPESRLCAATRRARGIYFNHANGIARRGAHFRSL